MPKPCRKCGSPNHTGFLCNVGRKPLATTKPLKQRKKVEPVCRICDNSGHYAFQCHLRKNTPLKSLGKLKRKGKAHKLWYRTRSVWLNDNRPDEAGFYYCYICGKPLRRKAKDGYEIVQLDHVQSRTRHPELRYEPDNLKPCCLTCNTAKGSLSLEEYLAKRDKEKLNGR